MADIHIHAFINGNKTTILCNERTIETMPPRLSLFIALHSVADHYMMQVGCGDGTTSQFFRGIYNTHNPDFHCCNSNAEKINFACDLLNKEHVFE